MEKFERTLTGIKRIESLRVSSTSSVTPSWQLANKPRNSREASQQVIDAAWGYLKAGRKDEAENILLNRLRVRESSLGASHRKLIPLLDTIGAFYVEIEEFQKAEEMFKRALECGGDKKGRRSRHIDVLKNYAGLLRKMGRAEEAQKMESRAQAMDLADTVRMPAVPINETLSVALTALRMDAIKKKKSAPVSAILLAVLFAIFVTAVLLINTR